MLWLLERHMTMLETKRRRADVGALIKFNIGKRHEHSKKKDRRRRLLWRAQLTDKKKFLSMLLFLSLLVRAHFLLDALHRHQHQYLELYFANVVVEWKRESERERILGQWVLSLCMSRARSLSLGSVFAFYDISLVERETESGNEPRNTIVRSAIE